MKRHNIFTISCIAIAIAGVITMISCTKENIESINSQSHILKISNSIDYGELHNAFLENAINNFPENAEFDDVLSCVNYVNEINKAYLNEFSIDDCQKEFMIECFDEYKWFISTPDFYDSLFIGNYSLNSNIENLCKFGVISEYEANVLFEISEIIENCYFRNIDNDETITRIRKIAKNHNSDSLCLLNGISDIALSSIEFWEEIGEEPIGEYPAYVPLQVAADVGGAIVSAGISAVRQYNSTGNVNGTQVLDSAVSGAVCASVGAAGKVGNAVCQAAKKVGKFLNKYL